MRTLYFMGREDQAETFRCRIYDGGPSEHEQEQIAFVDALAREGVVDAPAYDCWIAALDARGYLTSELEPSPCGTGRCKRWRLSDRGRAALAEVLS